MIIKNKAWKIRGFARLVQYLNKHVDEVEPEKDFSVFHNVLDTGKDLGGIIEQFVEQDRYRKERKGGNVLIHEWLSFHEEDTGQLTPVMLEDITQEYLRVRCPRGVAYAKPHYDKAHPHVHIMMAATNFKSWRKIHLDNASYNRVRRHMDRYQQEKYPQLSREHLVYENSLQRRRSRQQEQARFVVTQCLEQAEDLLGFYKRLTEAGAVPYERGGRTVGIVHHHRRHRFKTLEVDLKPLMEREKRSQELKRLMDERERHQEDRERRQ